MLHQHNIPPYLFKRWPKCVNIIRNNLRELEAYGHDWGNELVSLRLAMPMFRQGFWLWHFVVLVRNDWFWRVNPCIRRVVVTFVTYLVYMPFPHLFTDFCFIRHWTRALNHGGFWPFGTPRKFWTKTSSPIENSRSFDLRSCSALSYICLSEILRRFGRNRSNLFLGRRFRNNSTGVWPVTLLGVVRLLNRNLAKLCVIDELPSVLKCSLNVWTKRSAGPFDLGWYGATSVCFIPFCFIQSANCREVNCGPLSLTNCIGTPYRANIYLSLSIVDSLVTLGIISTSSHLEWLSTTTRNILFTNGPSKSMWILCQGVSGQSHGCSDAICGLFRVNWHLAQSRTTEAIDWSNLGHQTWSCASDFIRTIPGCPSCNSCKTRSRNEPGIKTRIPHNKQPSSTVSSFRLW